MIEIDAETLANIRGRNKKNGARYEENHKIPMDGVVNGRQSYKPAPNPMVWDADRIHVESLFEHEYVEQVGRLVRAGMSTQQIAVFFGVTRDCIQGWKREYPKFKEACDKSKVDAIAQVADAVFQRAVGHEHVITKEVWDRSTQTKVELKETQILPGDPASQKFYLASRDPDNWAQRNLIELTGKNGGAIKAITAEMSTNEAADIMKEMLKGGIVATEGSDDDEA